MKTKTYTAGARAAISSIIAHVKRKTKPDSQLNGVVLVLWLKKMDDRYNARPGGLGKK